LLVSALFRQTLQEKGQETEAPSREEIPDASVGIDIPAVRIRDVRERECRDAGRHFGELRKKGFPVPGSDAHDMGSPLNDPFIDLTG
jgi:hypothetical protein